MILKGSAGGYRVQAYNPHILEAVGEDCEFQVIPATQKILVQKKKTNKKTEQELQLLLATPRRKAGTMLLGITTICNCWQ